jgi:hypothetical protein
MHKPYCCINMCIYIYNIYHKPSESNDFSNFPQRAGAQLFFHPEEMEASTSDMAMPWGRTVNRRGKSPRNGGV